MTLTIPKNSSVDSVRRLVNRELATSVKIKSKKHRKTIQRTLRKILRELKRSKNGQIIFAGEIKSGKMIYHEISANLPITTKSYTCDNRFQVEYLRSLIKDPPKIGIVLIDRKQATIGYLKGLSFVQLHRISNSQVPSKHGKGGQSQNRLQNGIEILAIQHFKKVAELTKELLLDSESLVIETTILTDNFSRYLDYRLQDKLLGIYPLDDHGITGMRELVQRASKVLGDTGYTKERKLLAEFYEHLSKDDGYSVYGLNVDIMLNQNKVRDLVIPMGDYDEAESFRKIFGTGAILHYPVISK